jgi:hypothetical protein
MGVQGSITIAHNEHALTGNVGDQAIARRQRICTSHVVPTAMQDSIAFTLED